ncbi:hypothetical protein ACIOG8_36555 [Streptomyces erythrochromogenes]
MIQRDWKPADHRRGVERAAMAILAVAGAFLAAGGIAYAFVIMVYALS